MATVQIKGEITLDPGSLKNLKNIAKTKPLMDIGIRNALNFIGRQNIVYMRKTFLSKKNGLTYIVNGKPHVASAPLESPAVRTGNLFNNVGYEVRGVRKLEFGDYPIYGKYLELGTKNKDKSDRMLPRHHIMRTVRGRQQINIHILHLMVDIELKKNVT